MGGRQDEQRKDAVQWQACREAEEAADDAEPHLQQEAFTSGMNKLLHTKNGTAAKKRRALPPIEL